MYAKAITQPFVWGTDLVLMHMIKLHPHKPSLVPQRRPITQYQVVSSEYQLRGFSGSIASACDFAVHKLHSELS